MQLEWIPKTERFVARVKRAGDGVQLVRSLMKEHAFQLSEPRSTSHEAVLFTAEHYAAASFYDYATPEARAELETIHRGVQASWAKDSDAHIRCPADRELWPYQRAAVEYAIQRPHCLVGDQPGLGKTPTAICLANEIRARRVLVICPASIRLMWCDRIREWTTMSWGYTVHPILKAKHGVDPHANWTVVSYELASTPAIGAELAKRKYDLVILDEAHYLKTIEANRTRAVFGGGEDRAFPALASRAEKIVALTGTPLPNRPREAYALARALDWGSIDFASEEDFRSRFNPSAQGTSAKGNTYFREEVGRKAELYNRLRGNFMIRREKHGPNGVLPQLKLPIYDLVHAEETSAVKAALKAERLLDIDPERFGTPSLNLFGGAIAAVRRQMGEATAPFTAGYCEMLLDGGVDKLILFGWHVSVLDIWEKKLSKYGLIRIDGSTGAVKKDKLVKSFVNNPGIRIAIGNILSMGIGTDGFQHVCSHAIIGEPDWVPGNNTQAFDRIDRGGQTRQCVCDIVVAPGSFAEMILGKALRKGRNIHHTLDERVL